MKLTALIPGLALAVLLTGGAALAQSNGVPGPKDYTTFSRFVSDRNIFDPSRQPHTTFTTTHKHRSSGNTQVPGIRLVGTMNYEKGMFAFFAGSSTELSTVAQTGGTVAGYTVTDIVATNVVLEAAGTKEPHNLKIGDGLQQEGSKWVFVERGEISTAYGSGRSTGSSSNSTSSDSGSSAPAQPASAIEQNDVLKRLMQLREKENQ